MSNTKIAIITGGSSGIGYAVAKRFVAEGYTTIITGRNQEKLSKAAADLGAMARQLEMEKLDSIPAFVTEVVRDFGSIDVLVNNAGMNQKKPLMEVTNEDFSNMVLTNQTGLFVMTREVARVMSAQAPGGAIINISSMASQYGIPKVISYTATKSAIEGMTRAMAVDLSPLGIRVNCVAPGFISTPMTDKAFNDDPERKAKVLGRTPMGRMGTPDEIANAVFFLASEQASFITGVILKVDGGNSIGF